MSLWSVGLFRGFPRWASALFELSRQKGFSFLPGESQRFYLLKLKYPVTPR